MQGCDTESACGVGIMLREGFCDSFDVLPDTKLYYQRAIPITNSQSAASTRLFRDVDTGRDASLRLAGYHTRWRLPSILWSRRRAWRARRGAGGTGRVHRRAQRWPIGCHAGQYR